MNVVTKDLKTRHSEKHLDKSRPDYLPQIFCLEGGSLVSFFPTYACSLLGMGIILRHSRALEKYGSLFYRKYIFNRYLYDNYQI